MCDELKIFLEKNPWAAIKDGSYGLENEKDAAGNEQYQFHTDLPPQPFQGNPEAPIWILMLNPCYSKDDKEYYEKETERKEAMLNQLSFTPPKEENHWHYVLDNSEKNFSRKWFDERFIKNKDMGITADNVDDKIFILQACGYASEKFDSDLNKMTKSFPHMRFAQELARWGLRHGKTILIARSRKYWLEVLQSAMKEKNFSDIYCFCSYLNLSFSSGNIISYERVKKGWNSKDEYRKFKQESAQELKKIIENQ